MRSNGREEQRGSGKRTVRVTDQTGKAGSGSCCAVAAAPARQAATALPSRAVPHIAAAVVLVAVVVRTSRARVKALGIRLNGTRPKNKSRDIPSDFSASCVCESGRRDFSLLLLTQSADLFAGTRNA